MTMTENQSSEIDDWNEGLKESSGDHDQTPAHNAGHSLDDLVFVPGIDSYIGRGYDIFGGYSSPDAVKSPIYAFDDDDMVKQATIDKSLSLNSQQMAEAFNTQSSEMKMWYKRPQHIGYTDRFMASVTTEEINTATGTELITGAGASIRGTYAGFSGSAKSKIDTKKTRLATTKIATTTAKIVYWTLDLSGYSFSSPPAIKPDVREDFESESVDKLIQKYGTHLLQKVGIGSKIIHHYTIDTSKFTDNMDIKASIAAGYEGGGLVIDGDANASYNESKWRDKKTVEVSVETWGVSDIQLGEITVDQATAEHPLSILKQGWHNPTLVEFYEDSLLPLWEVGGLMPQAKQKSFKARVEELAKEKNQFQSNMFAGLKPLYLLSTPIHATNPDKKRYRLSPRTTYSYDKDNHWACENDEKPWLTVSAEKKLGMVPLFEFAHNKNKDVVRYETAAWGRQLKHTHTMVYSDITIPNIMVKYDDWEKTSDLEVGWVYEHPMTANETQPPSNAYPVYAYYDANLDPNHGILFGNQAHFIWDNGQWETSSELSLMTKDMLRQFQNKLNTWWGGKSGWDQFFQFGNIKPSLHSAQFRVDIGVIFAGDTIVVTPGIPHWHGVR